MSTLKVNNLQVGQDGTAANNYTLYQPASPDGTVRLGYGVSGSVTDILTLKNSRLGIGENNPSAKLQVLGGNGDQLWLDNAGERYTQISLRNNGTQKAALWLDETNDEFDLFAATGYGIRFLAGGTEKLLIDSSGRIGIGGNGVGSGLGVYLQRSAPNTVHFYEASDGTKKMITGVDSTNDYVKIGSLSNHRLGLVANNGERLSILPSGNIGIGETSPVQALHVRSASSTQYTAIAADTSHAIGGGVFDAMQNGTRKGVFGISGWLNSNTDDDPMIYTVSGKNLRFYVGGTDEKLRITSAGTLDFKSTDGVGINFRESGYINIDSDNDDSSRNFSFYDAKGTGSEKRLMILTDAGRVGIDQSSPQSKVQIDLGDSVNYQNGDCFTLTSGDGSSANLVNKLNFGVSSTNNYAWIQSIKPGTDSRNLVLQPSGGNVGINCTPTEKFHINGGNGDKFKLDCPNNYSNSSSIIMSQERGEIKTTINASGGNPGGSMVLRTRNTAGTMVDAITIESSQQVSINSAAGTHPLIVSNGGTQRLRINANGNVSVGIQDRRRHQIISGKKAFSSSNSYIELFYSGHSHSITIQYSILQGEAWQYGGAHGKVDFFTVYGSTNGMQNHTHRRLGMNGGQISGDAEFQYMNSGGSTSHIIRVRVPYSSTSLGSFQIAYSVSGLSDGDMYAL